jgi:hypothetical protein
VLLGVVKYFWAQTVFLLGRDKTLALFQTRLGSIDINGLHAPCLNADYICAYKGGLIGKHFKSLAQVMPFLVYNLVPKSVLNGWHAIGELVVLLWHTSIEDREVYLVCIILYLREFWLILSQANLSRVIDDFLTITAQCAPSILISKPKFHFLLHLPAYIHRFGPTILFSTERYELFNHVFRLASIYSNRQAPSHDTCNTFAAQDSIKHIVFGGYWFDSSVKCWVRAGKAILQYIDGHPEHARYLGFHDEKPRKLGQ